MVVDCIVKEFKLYDKEAETAARVIKALSNDGYKVSAHYSAGNIGGVLIVATKDKEEADEPDKPKRTTRKKTE